MGFEGGVMFAVNGFRNADAPLAAALNNGTQLSRRSAALCIFAMSLLSWAIVALPLWAIIR
jgi:hypothetical protein